MKVLRKNSLIISLLVALPLFSLIAPAVHASSFGSAGSSGYSGPRGTSGNNGADQTLFADGQNYSFDISGTDGYPGEDGTNGSDAYSCSFYSDPAYDMYGAKGGDGGDGGDGGSGGRGGNVTAYYQKIEDLKKIFIISRGGRGSSGGRGGYAGDGCRCSRSSWSIQTCSPASSRTVYDPRPGTTLPNECTSTTYYCHNGADGRRGSDGSYGSQGSDGILSIIKGSEQLPQDHPAKSATLAQLENKNVVLTQHRWKNHSSGAKKLLAQGSMILDSYYEYQQTWSREFALLWQSSRAVELFKNSLPLQIKENEIAVDYPRDWWMDVEKKTEGQLTTHTIKGIVTAAEARDASVGVTHGTYRNLVLDVTDNAGVIDLVKAKFRITYERKQALWHRHVYTGDVPENLVTKVGNTYKIAVGQLPIGTAFSNRGRKIRITITIDRSYAGQSTKWTIAKKLIIQ